MARASPSQTSYISEIAPLLLASLTESAARAIAEALCALPAEYAWAVLEASPSVYRGPNFRQVIAQELRSVGDTRKNRRALLVRCYFGDDFSQTESTIIDTMLLDVFEKAGSVPSTRGPDYELEFTLTCFENQGDKYTQQAAKLIGRRDLSKAAPASWRVLCHSVEIEALCEALSAGSRRSYRQALEIMLGWRMAEERAHDAVPLVEVSAPVPQETRFLQAIYLFASSSEEKLKFMTVLWELVRDFIQEDRFDHARELIGLARDLERETGRRWFAARGEWPLPFPNAGFPTTDT